MSQEQSLPGAYYGPALPPSQGSNSWGSFCSRYKKTFISFLIGLAFGLVFLVLLLWQLYRPVHVRVFVTQASLTQFNLTAVPGGNSLAYNLSTTMLIQNRNRRVGIYYDQIMASASFREKRFGSVFFRPFYQPHRATTPLLPSFSGQSAITLSSFDLQEFDKQRRAGAFDLTLLLQGQIRFRNAFLTTARRTMIISCDIRAPLVGIFAPICSVSW